MGMYNRKEYAKLKAGERPKPKTNTGPGRTKQEFREEADMNVIMARYIKTGQLPAGVALQQAPVFADVSGYGDFADVLRRVHAAEEAFAALPPALRSRFENDPAKLVAFVSDDRNRAEAAKLGLLRAEAVVAPEAPKEPAKPEVKEVKAS